MCIDLVQDLQVIKTKKNYSLTSQIITRFAFSLTKMPTLRLRPPKLPKPLKNVPFDEIFPYYPGHMSFFNYNIYIFKIKKLKTIINKKVN
jgi:hypothetical protein